MLQILIAAQPKRGPIKYGTKGNAGLLGQFWKENHDDDAAISEIINRTLSKDEETQKEQLLCTGLGE